MPFNLYCTVDYIVIEYISTYYCTMSHKSEIFFKEFFFLKKIRFNRLCFVQLWAHMYFLSFCTIFIHFWLAVIYCRSGVRIWNLLEEPLHLVLVCKIRVCIVCIVTLHRDENESHFYPLSYWVVYEQGFGFNSCL